MNGQRIVDIARQALGTPFVHQGRRVGSGLDCAGLIYYTAIELGLPVADVEGYARRPSGDLLRAALEAQPCLKRKPADKVAPGDVLLIRFGRYPQHLAIYTGTTIIHAWETSGKVCEHDFGPQWLPRIVCAYQFEGVAA